MKIIYISFRDYTALPFVEELRSRGAEAEYVGVPASHRMIAGSLQALSIPKDALVILEGQAAWFVYALRARLSLARHGYLVRLEGDPFTEAAENPQPFRTAWDMVLRTGLGGSNGIIHVSNYLKTVVAGRVPRTIHRVVHNGVDIREFSPAAGSEPDYTSLIGPKDNNLDVVTLMNFDIPRKLNAFADVAESLSRLSSGFDFRLWLIGDGPYRDRVAQILGGVKNVRFVGAIPRSLVPRVLPMFDIFFYPSSLDAYPNSILEASSCGLPILASCTGGIPEQVDHGRTGFLMTDTPKQVYPYLKQLIENGRLRSEFGRSARKKAESEFNWEANRREFVRTVLELTDST